MAPRGLHVFRINARELLRQPGLDKRIEVTLDAAELGVDDERLAGPVDVDLSAVSTIDGITVHGSISMPWHAACRRCLTDVDGVARIDVDEVYQDEVADGADAFQIEGDQIDLAPAIREYLLLELPSDPLCRATCAGICSVCGIDHNTGTCTCDTTVRDDRWAALDDLRLDD